MKNLTALFILMLGFLVGCKSTSSTTEKVGEVYVTALVQSSLGCTVSPLAWTSQETNHYVVLLGFTGSDHKVAVVKVLEEVRGLPVGAPEICKLGEVAHVPATFLQVDKELRSQK